MDVLSVHWGLTQDVGGCCEGKQEVDADRTRHESCLFVFLRPYTPTGQCQCQPQHCTVLCRSVPVELKVDWPGCGQVGTELDHRHLPEPGPGASRQEDRGRGRKEAGVGAGPCTWLLFGTVRCSQQGSKTHMEGVVGFVLEPHCKGDNLGCATWTR